jgi:hypothetical protein
MGEELPKGGLALKDTVAFIPLIASSFAFTFVVGYFSGFDIDWFPFFSLPEHLVFALRALPIAIAASIGLFIALRFSKPEHRWKTLQNKDGWFVWGWVFILVVMAAYFFWQYHPGLFLSFVVIAIGAIVHHWKPTSHMSSANVLYWATTVMVLSFLAGFGSAYVSQLDRICGISRNKMVDLLVGTPREIVLDTDDGQPKKGHVVFVGNAGVLFYELKTKELQLFRPDKIKKVSSFRDTCS